MSLMLGGSGLGLWISREITEMMDGDIGVASEEGIGSTFLFFVKTQIAVRPDETMQATGGSPGVNSKTRSTMAHPLSYPFSQSKQQRTPIGPRPLPGKVLVVEDNLVNQKVLCKGLVKRGYTVSAANHGGEALAALYETSSYHNGDQSYERDFDVILLDLEMPICDGITCIRQIRLLEAEGLLGGHVAVVAVTANARIEHVQAALAAGMDAVTTKPYRLEDLVEKMESAFWGTREGRGDPR